jgi:hypothetical protein
MTEEQHQGPRGYAAHRPNAGEIVIHRFPDTASRDAWLAATPGGFRVTGIQAGMSKFTKDGITPVKTVIEH